MKQLLSIGFCLAFCGLSAQRKLVWEENFDGKKLDEKVWNIETGDHGWGNNERQMYTKENHRLENGHLVITAKKTGEQYTSTRINTKDKKEFQYGRIEARVKLSTGYGIWPAFWMLGGNISEVGWPKSGEIDIMEYIGREPHTIYTTLHTSATHGEFASSQKTTIKNIEEGFHVFAVDWSAEKMDFFVDDKLVHTYNPAIKDDKTWPFDQPFYVLVNMAVGGNFGGPDVDNTILPQEYTIDYIRVYQ